MICFNPQVSALAFGASFNSRKIWDYLNLLRIVFKTSRLGWLGSGSQHDQSTYGSNYLSRNRLLVEAMYRSSWVVGQVVDVVADDMTRHQHARLESPEDAEEINQELDRLQVWDKLNKTIKWFGFMVVQLLS
jgi:hypothetical protein